MQFHSKSAAFGAGIFVVGLSLVGLSLVGLSLVGLTLLQGCGDPAPWLLRGDAGGAVDGASDARELGISPDIFARDSRPREVDRCGGGGRLRLSDGRVSVRGVTTDLRNEYGRGVRCGQESSFAGPQRYYTVELDHRVHYRFTLEADFPAAMYLFATCGPTGINGDCAGAGGGGLLLGPLEPSAPAGGGVSAVFSPSAIGLYELAVDSLSEHGTFTLTIEAFTDPKDSRCAGATVLPWTSAGVSVSGTTLGATDDFGAQIRCGGGLPLPGPQRYFRVSLRGGTPYALKFEADHPAALYAFSADAGCDAVNIEADCASVLGTVIKGVVPQKPVTAFFTPLLDGDVLLAVDSPLVGARQGAGHFTLTVAEAAAPSGMVCEDATALVVQDGIVSVSASTEGLFNDRGALMGCGGSPLLGPQRYYSVELEARPYALTLKPSFDAVLAVGGSCRELPADCASAGLVGDALTVAQGQSSSLRFEPRQPGAYKLSVDSLDPFVAGEFELSIEALEPVEIGQCATPRLVDSASLPQTLRGDTGALRNDLKPVTCGGIGGVLLGPQAYYRLSIPAGQVRTLSLLPQGSFDPALYAFSIDSPCEAKAVDAGCAGHLSDRVGGGVEETLVLGPEVTDTDWIIAVDSWSASEVGRYTLTIATAP